MRRALVVATVHLSGLGPGDPVYADLDDPQVERWLRGGMLRLLEADPQPMVWPDPQAEAEG